PLGALVAGVDPSGCTRLGSATDLSCPLKLWGCKQSVKKSGTKEGTPQVGKVVPNSLCLVLDAHTCLLVPPQQQNHPGGGPDRFQLPSGGGSGLGRLSSAVLD